MDMLLNMETAEQKEGGIRLLSDKIDQLAEKHRTECLWFLRRDYLPTTTDERLRVLKTYCIISV